MKLTNHSNVPVYTISGASTARPLPEWLARKRKRSLKHDPEYANRIELLQDFEFDEASSCVRASDDGDWVVSTGTYKPQIHVHYLPHLSLSYMRHTDTENQTFLLLSSDYSKQLHLQADRSLELHTPTGCHYTTRIPRYGRDLRYDRRSTEALIPSVGLNQDGHGEVFRLNLELGRFMRGYDVDVGSDDSTSQSLQGSVNTGSVNVASIAEDSHNLLAFGTSIGTVEFHDSRSRSRVGVLSPPPSLDASSYDEITALQFAPSGLNLASGFANGLIYLYDLRSPVPLLKKDQGYGYPIQTLTFLSSSTSSSQNSHLVSDPKIMSSDKRIIKIWDTRDGSPWTSVEPAVDLHCVEWCKDSGMFLTANEGRQQHSFFIPQLGPAPRWCSFLDNLVEEMAEDTNDPSAFGSQKAGEVYDNYKFLTTAQLRQLNLDHLVGTTSLLRPYMHGYFVNQQLYEEARLISNPEAWQEQRQKSIRQKIEKERESRIRGSKKEVSVKVNRRFAEQLLQKDEKNAQRKARRALDKGNATNGTDVGEASDEERAPPGPDGETDPQSTRITPLTDARFAALFQDKDFEIDETSKEYQALNPGSKPSTAAPSASDTTKRLTAAEREELDSVPGSSADEDEESGSESPRPRFQNQQKQSRRDKMKRPPAKLPQMRVSSSASQSRLGSSISQNSERARTFGSRASQLSSSVNGRAQNRTNGKRTNSDVSGEKSVTFKPSSGKKSRDERQGGIQRANSRGNKDRRSASNNVFRGL